MNPDYYNGDEFVDGFIIWKITDSDGNTASFKVLDKGNGRTVIITDESGGSIVVDKDNAREHWKVYMNRGFRLTNSRVIHDMGKPHNKKSRKESIRSKYDVGEKAAAAEYKKVMEDFKNIHENDLQEMRINPKDFYRNPIMECTNYALEA